MKICDTCRYYNSNIPCGSTPSACKEADKFAEEFVDGLKKLKQTEPTISKMEQVGEPQTQLTAKCLECNNSKACKENNWQDCRYEPLGYEVTAVVGTMKDEPQTECNKLINEVVKLDMSREDKFKVIELLERHCEKCKHYLFTDIDGYYCEHETYGQPCGYEPKDEPQTDCDGCQHYADEHTADACYECKRSYADCYVPQTERSE